MLIVFYTVDENGNTCKLIPNFSKVFLLKNMPNSSNTYMKYAPCAHIYPYPVFISSLSAPCPHPAGQTHKDYIG